MASSNSLEFGRSRSNLRWKSEVKDDGNRVWLLNCLLLIEERTKFVVQRVDRLWIGGIEFVKLDGSNSVGQAGADWEAWHVSGGPVGPPARWAATSNVEGGSGTEEEVHRPLAREGGLYTDRSFARAPSS